MMKILTMLLVLKEMVIELDIEIEESDRAITSASTTKSCQLDLRPSPFGKRHKGRLQIDLFLCKSPNGDAIADEQCQ